MTQSYAILLAVATGAVTFALSWDAGVGREMWSTPNRLIANIANTLLGLTIAVGIFFVDQIALSNLSAYLLMGWAIGGLASTIPQLIRHRTATETAGSVHH